MATPKLEAVSAIISQTTGRNRSCAPVAVTARLGGDIAQDKHERHCDHSRRSAKPGNGFLNSRNAFIALLAMLIMLLTLQGALCCDAPVAPDSTLLSPPVQEQEIRRITSLDDTTAAAASASISTRPSDSEAVAQTGSGAETPVIKEMAAPAPASPEPTEIILASAAPLAPDPGSIRSDAVVALTVADAHGFVKLAQSGDVLDDDAESWECVEDRGNQLTWEVKTNDGGIRDRDHSYSWLEDGSGRSDGGRCKGGPDCDTRSYARAMNEQKLCGFSDWRLPTKEELETLVEYTDDPKQATINSVYFPEAVPSWYWTASEHPRRQEHAWYVLFRNGIALNDLKERPKHIRLVRGNPQK
jgi:hypothetical protein